jgi:hypothetical protein
LARKPLRSTREQLIVDLGDCLRLRLDRLGPALGRIGHGPRFSESPRDPGHRRRRPRSC